MYRILLADDEGIMLDSLSNMIRKEFGEEFEVYTAKSGRMAIELAESMHPDIIFMDIQMPGINGIDALREIRKNNSSALCYIISAYDTFDYAKDAIDLGVEKYLMKPVTKKTVIPVLEEAKEKVDENRRLRSDRLRIQEKLETVIPVVENGFISSILLQSDWQDAQYYQQLLDVTEEYGYAVVLQMGVGYQNGRLVSPVGMSVRAQGFYPELCAVIKSYFRCVIGSVITNRVVFVVPDRNPTMDYEGRIRTIETMRELLNRLENRLNVKFRAGIGRTQEMKDLRASYQEAVSALAESTSRVVHTDDISSHGLYEDNFPAETENRMFEMFRHGNVEGMQAEANAFFDWMQRYHPDNLNNIRLKVLEFILGAEKEAFHMQAVNYSFNYRKDYLSHILELDSMEDIRTWFLEKMTAVCQSVRDKKEEQSESVVQRAKAYIHENYSRDISLDDVSKEVNVSPYYFSKLFKEEEGENFIEYLTRIRMEKARELLAKPGMSIKEISMACGYSDPNYFSRLFKKQMDQTPREYREQKTGF